MYTLRLPALFLGIALVACTARPSADNMQVRHEGNPRKIGSRIFVEQATGGGENDILAHTIVGEVNIPNEEFTEAVRNSMLESGFFDGPARNFNEEWGLRVKIINVDTSLAVIIPTASGNVVAQYSIYYKGNLAYEFEVASEGNGMSLLGTYGSIRADATEDAAQNNITEFLKRFAEYDFSDILEPPVQEKIAKKKEIRIVGRIFSIQDKKVEIIAPTPLKIGKVYSVVKDKQVRGAVRIDQLFHSKCNGRIVSGRSRIAKDMEIGL